MKLNDSVLEITERIVDFICKLVYKDEVKAFAAETQVSAASAAEYLSAHLKTDNNSEERRAEIIANYIELNEYYKNLQTTFSIEPYVSRLSKDMDIIYQPPQDVLNYPYLYKYRSLYKQCLQSFYVTSYAQSMTGKDNYREFCLFTINMMAYTNLLTRWLEDPFDVEIMDETQLDRFMQSFGISFFTNLPFKYKRLIARNLNSLISKKGTEAVVIDILEIFNFKDIDIFKYFLAKSTTDGEVGVSGANDSRKSKDSDVRFLSHSIRETSLNEAIKHDRYKKHEFEDVIKDDPYWLVSKDEVKTLDFDYIQTKYFSVETGFELSSETMNTVFMINLLRQIRENYPNREFMNVYSKLIHESRSAALEDILIALQILVCDYMGLVDVIEYNLEGLSTIYSIASYDPPAVNATLYADNPNAIRDIDEISLIDMSRVATYDGTEASKVWSKGLKVKGKLEGLMAKETGYKKYKRLKAAYNAKFTQKLSYQIFNGAETFTDYLATRNSDLYAMVTRITEIEDDDKRRSEIERTISDLTDVINGTLVDFELFVGTISLNIVMFYLKHIIRTFKSFTVSLKELDIFFVIREQYQTRLLDSMEHAASMLMVAANAQAHDKVSFLKHHPGFTDEVPLLYDYIDKLTTFLAVDEKSKYGANFFNIDAVEFGEKGLFFNVKSSLEDTTKQLGRITAITPRMPMLDYQTVIESRLKSVGHLTKKSSSIGRMQCSGVALYTTAACEDRPVMRKYLSNQASADELQDKTVGTNFMKEKVGTVDSFQIRYT